AVCRSPGVSVGGESPNTPAASPVDRTAPPSTVPGTSCGPVAATAAASGGECVVMLVSLSVRAAVTLLEPSQAAGSSAGPRRHGWTPPRSAGAGLVNNGQVSNDR